MIVGNMPVYLLYVIGLHTIQFGNNWMKKKSEDSQNWTVWQSEEVFESNYFQIGQHVVLLTIFYTSFQNGRH